MILAVNNYDLEDFEALKKARNPLLALILLFEMTLEYNKNNRIVRCIDNKVRER